MNAAQWCQGATCATITLTALVLISLGIWQTGQDPPDGRMAALRMYNGSALAWAAGGRQAFDGQNFLLRVSDPYDEYRASHGESGTFTLNKADGGDKLPDLERGDVQSGGRVYRYPHAPFTPLRYEARVPLPRLAMGTQGSDGKLFVKDTVLQVEELGNMYDDDCHKSLSTAKEGGTPWHFGDKCRSVIVSFAVKACREQPLQVEQQHCLAVGAYYDDTLGRDKCRAVQRLVGASILVRRSDVDSVTRGDGDKAVAGKSWRPAPGWCNDTRMCPTRGAGFSLQMADHSSVLTYGNAPGASTRQVAFAQCVQNTRLSQLHVVVRQQDDPYVRAAVAAQFRMQEGHLYFGDPPDATTLRGVVLLGVGATLLTLAALYGVAINEYKKPRKFPGSGSEQAIEFEFGDSGSADGYGSVA